MTMTEQLTSKRPPDEYLTSGIEDLASVYGVDAVLAEVARVLHVANLPPIQTPAERAMPITASTSVGGKVGADHPNTSRVAASGDKRPQRVRLLQVLAAAGPSGLTCYEAAAKLGLTPNQTATRMMELREAGDAVRTRAERATTPGNHGLVHVAAVHMPDGGR